MTSSLTIVCAVLYLMLFMIIIIVGPLGAVAPPATNSPFGPGFPFAASGPGSAAGLGALMGQAAGMMQQLNTAREDDGHVVTAGGKPRSQMSHAFHFQRNQGNGRSSHTSLQFYRDALNTTISDEELYTGVMEFYELLDLNRIPYPS
jgi:hypothetical protein